MCYMQDAQKYEEKKKQIEDTTQPNLFLVYTLVRKKINKIF